MALYKQKGSKVWWYEFQFNGQRIRESAKTTSKVVAKEAERARRRQLEENYNSIKKPEMPKLFPIAAEEYMAVQRQKVTAGTMEIIEREVSHLLPYLRTKTVADITHLDIKRFIDGRLAQGVANRTVNIGLQTLRAIMRRNHQWERLRPDFAKLKERKSAGRELTEPEEERLLRECRLSCSRVLFPAVTLGLYAGMRFSEIRLLRWRQIDLAGACVTVGESKTEHGEGRLIPLIGPALDAMTDWAAKFPDRLPEHCVFPAERYSFNAKEELVRVHNYNPNRPIGTWSGAWTAARRRAGVKLRFHDLRHTTVTRLLEKRSIEEIASIMGWSSSTMVEMMNRYQHRNLEKKRETMAALLPKNYQTQKHRSSAVGQSGAESSLSQPEFLSAAPNSRYDREKLYEQVWTLPLRTLAREYGVSDVALAKACRKLHVPLPGRGYWAKKAANQPVEERPPLPPV